MGKRAIYVGSSGPIGYDYRWTKDEALAGAEPYAILEDLNGILLCYDELLFAARAFCPREMWDLPYVKFLEDDASKHERIAIAAEQYSQFRPHLGSGGGSTSYLPDIIERITSGHPEGVDNHGRSVVVAGSYGVTGNAGDLDQVIMDMGIAASLEIPNLDVLTNTLGTQRLANQIATDTTFLGSGYKSWHLTVASEIARVRIANTYSQGRSYFEDIEELREHSNLRDFRAMLSSKTPDEGTAKDAAAEISDMVDRFAAKQVSKMYARRPWYRTVGKIAVGPVGNVIHPGVGTAANGALKVIEYVGEKEDRAIGAWAAFVADVRRSA